MKVLAAALAVLLLVAICSLAEADPGDFSNPSNHLRACCVTYISRPIPPRLITSAYWTSKSCPKPAVVLVTKNGREVCADPEARWVQKYLQDLKTREY